MKKTFILFFLGGIILLVVSSCCRTVECKQGFANIAFVGFDAAETEVFYLRRYQSNSGFAVRIDTAVYRKNDVFYNFKQDTIFIRSNDGWLPPQGSFFIAAGHDYEVVLPATGQVFRITELTETNKEERICGMQKSLCATVINKLKVNGVAYNGTAVFKR